MRGIEPAQAKGAAELFHLSFGAKLAGFVLLKDRDAAIELLADSFCLDEIYGAFDPSGNLVGVAFITGHGPVLCVRREAVRAAFGRFGGAWRYAVYRVTQWKRRSYPKDSRGLEGFSVSPALRGQGIGTAMLDRIISDAKAEGARVVDLNVGDNNPARHLYERAGFEQVRVSGVGPFAGRLGFSHFVFYELKL